MDEKKVMKEIVVKSFVRIYFLRIRSILLFRTLVLSSIGQLFVLPLLIWNPDNRHYYGLFISSIFTILCHTQALHGKFNLLQYRSSAFLLSFSFSIIISIDLID